MIQKNYDTVTQAMTGLKNLGYTIDFSILADKECLICHVTATTLSPNDFEIDDFYRFEGDSDPGDQMIVYAISSKKNNIKGIIVNAYGIHADNASSAIVKKLNTHPKQNTNDLTDNNTHYFKNEEDNNVDSSPEGIVTQCSNCSVEMDNTKDL